MPAHPSRAAPLPAFDHPLAPHQLWGCLSASQQQHVRTVLISVAHQLLAHLPHHPPPKEASHACQSPSQSDENHALSPGA